MFIREFFKSVKSKPKFVRCISADTIFSLSSGSGKCGVAVIRVSGCQTKKALRTIVGEKYEPKERHAYLKNLYHSETKEVIDKGLVLWFPGPASFTGEDSCEFQVHGSLAVIASMLDALGKISGLRPAAPGEFTKRAFFGGKLDLTEVEGLADLIHAETEAQRKQALFQCNGSLSRIYDDWRKRLIRCVAYLEAYIDFAEGENIGDDIILQLEKDLRRIATEIHTHLNDQRQGEMLRDGIRAAIIGAPNVGKSSFLNLMCQRKISIVTPIAGTTRDIIETTYNFGGYPVIFSDTAGLRKRTSDVVELEGIARTKECLQSADLIILLMDAFQLSIKQVHTDSDLTKYVHDYMINLDLNEELLSGKQLQLIANKIDLLSQTDVNQLQKLNNLFLISCTKEHNIVDCLKRFEDLLKETCGLPTLENPRITHSRYRQQLERCTEHIKIFLDEYTPDIYPDIAVSAQKLRSAIRCIERITGHVSNDSILDVVFKDFCIGK